MYTEGIFIVDISQPRQQKNGQIRCSAHASCRRIRLHLTNEKELVDDLHFVSEELSIGIAEDDAARSRYDAVIGTQSSDTGIIYRFAKKIKYHNKVYLIGDDVRFVDGSLGRIEAILLMLDQQRVPQQLMISYMPYIFVTEPEATYDTNS